VPKLPLISTRRALSRTKTLDFLDMLAMSPGDEACTLYLPPHPPTTEIDNTFKEIPAQQDVLTQLVKLASSSETGAVIFWSNERKCLVLPPFPISEKHFTHSTATEQLRSLLDYDYIIALVLVRLGSYAVGVCQGEKLVSSKVGTGLIHGRHKKGGSSAHRFERHRDKQIESFLTRVCQRAQEQLEPYEKVLDYVVYGGARTTIQLLYKQCAYIGKLDTPALPPLFDIPEPRQTVLETAVSRVWSITVVELQED
jgi:hypothetical protein